MNEEEFLAAMAAMGMEMTGRTTSYMDEWEHKMTQQSVRVFRPQFMSPFERRKCVDMVRRQLQRIPPGGWPLP